MMTSADWVKLAEIAASCSLLKPGSTVRYINADTFVEKLREEAAAVKKREEARVIGDPLEYKLNTKVQTL